MKLVWILTVPSLLADESDHAAGGPSDENFDYYNPSSIDDDYDPFKNAAEIHEADRADFEDSDDIVNHSEKLTDARFSEVDNIDSGAEIREVGGWGGGYHAQHAINGNRFGGSQIFSNNHYEGRDNWFADILDSPTVSFIKLWPGDWIGSWCHYSTYRVFVDSTECFPIEDYTDTYTSQLRNNREPAIWNCPTAVSGATQIRVASTSWISFRELEIYEADECPLGPEETCGMDQIEDVNRCQRRTCGRPVRGHQSCSNNVCQCKHPFTKETVDYHIAKCDCPDGYEGEWCQFRTGNLPCAKNPCNQLDGGDTHTCRNVFGETAWDTTYKCYCRNGHTGTNCENPPPCFGASCSGSGDVHYYTFDTGPYYDNMGFCQYVLTTNGGCSDTLSGGPIESNGLYQATSVNQDYFAVVVDQTNLLHFPTGEVPISRLEGLVIYWRPKSNGVLYRIRTHNDYQGWIWEVSTGAVDGENWSNLGLVQSNMNFRTESNNLHLALRMNGNSNTIYIGAGTLTGDNTWADSASSTVPDYLMKIQYNKATYGSISAQTACALKNLLCGICGNYDDQLDHDRATYHGYSGRREWERWLEREHYWSHSDKCEYRNKEGNPVPTELLSLKNSRKKRQTVDAEECAGDYDQIVAECSKLNAIDTFSNCGLDKENKVKACIFDSCMVPEALDVFVCSTLKSYVDECNDEGGDNKIESWRTGDLCPLPCGDNSHFEGCTAIPCWATVSSCVVDQDACDASSQCVEGCFCNEGYIQDGAGNCILNDGNQCQEEQQAEMQTKAASAVPCASTPCENGGACVHLFEDGEAVGYECECLDGFVGIHCEMKMSMDSTEELLGQLLAETDVSVDDVLYHGCYCPSVAGDSLYHGNPVSAFDKICQRLAHCKFCSADIECADQSGFPFMLTGDDMYFTCDADKNNACQQASCECSFATMNAMVDYIIMNGVDEVPYESCTQKATVKTNRQCCGMGGKWMVYSADSNLVCDTENYDGPVLLDSETGFINREMNEEMM